MPISSAKVQLTSIAAHLRTHATAVVENLPPAGLAYLLAVERFDRPLLIVTPDEERSATLSQEALTLGVTDVVLFPGETHVPFAEVSCDAQSVAQRYALRHRLTSAASKPSILVTSAAALQSRWMSQADFQAASQTWHQGSSIEREAIAAHLILCGYQRVNLVEDEGTFAIRGGILDIFAHGLAKPVRIDFFGDEISSIKTFEVTTQHPSTALNAITIHPIRDVLFTEETVTRASKHLAQLAEREESTIPTRRLRGLLEAIEQRQYFFGIESLWPIFFSNSEPVLETLLQAYTATSQEQAAVVVVLDDPHAIDRALHERHLRTTQERERAIAHHQPVTSVAAHLHDAVALLTRLQQLPCVHAQTLADDRLHQPLPIRLGQWTELAQAMSARRQDASQGEILDPLEVQLRQRMAQGHEIFFVCSSRGSAERLRELLAARRIDLPILTSLPDASTWGTTRSPRRGIVVGFLQSGLFDDARGVALWSDTDIFGTALAAPRATVKRRRQPNAAALTTLRDLQEGDPVIHVDHGIGRYVKLQRLVLNGVDGDYVQIEYAGGDKLYLPVFRLNLLQRFRGNPALARLDKLGGTRWEKTKQRVRDAVAQIAHELLAIQARRKAIPGFKLTPPNEHFRAFEATFPFDETPDQQRAIDEVLTDLTQDVPMDRVVCGDVGFGKTEVAVRAAYLAALSGRQVAVLVPTTVLAEQHGATFTERLKSEPITVGVLSRFRNPAQTHDLLTRLKNGALDIVIGTHRLLSHDVVFKNLGLLVVDEEQRFGVKQKERIKQWRSQVHVLTLSATPIPRTLHMATVGLRDLSIIQTPPAERMAIRTEVTRFDDAVVTEAIRRELHRGGQVFVVHNRVQSIHAMAGWVQRLVPEARVAIAHGQMSAEKLERIMVDFVHHESNVLVCTAIIESGIDIPAANTMIVNRADTFGLAQLYQLRGRIGRGHDRAYAYLLLPRSDKITPAAASRLAALKRFSALGSGFQIAAQDLELRGAGDLLGADQSGNIHAVGFELYTELLAQAVEHARGQPKCHAMEPDIKLPITGVLPEDYVAEPMQRLAYYQRMAQADNDTAIFDLLAEIRDLYGDPPPEVEHLAHIMVIRRRLRHIGASALNVTVQDGLLKMGLSFVPDSPINRMLLVQRCQELPQQYRLLPSGRLLISLPHHHPEPTTVLHGVQQELSSLMGL